MATCINLYRQAIKPDNFIESVNQEINNDWSEIQWTNSRVGNGIVDNYRTSAEADISHLEKGNSNIALQFQQISSFILKTIMHDYREEYLVHTSGYEGWRLLKYAGGGEYHAHYDHAPNNQRVVSLVAFLETPEKGGHLEFPFFDVTVQATAGDVVVFPSCFPYVHIAHPVTSGTKCSLVTWFQ